MCQNKGKQTNKQGSTCRGADAGGSVEFHCSGVWCAIHQSMQTGFRDVLEMHWRYIGKVQSSIHRVIPLRKVNMCKYLPIGSIIILPDDVYKSSKIMLPKEGLCL